MDYKKYFFIALLAAILLLSSLNVFASGAASINLSPVSGSYKEGDSFSMAILINPSGVKFDTARVKLSYPSDLLEIKNFTSGSAFSFQAGSNGFDNKVGNFSWGSGISGGTDKPTTFGTIVFKVLKQGQAKISVDASSLILSDGQNNFNEAESFVSYTFLARPVEIVQKNPEPNLEPEPSQTASVLSENEEESEVETTIFATGKPKDLTASIFGTLSFRWVTLLWIVSLILLALAFLYVILHYFSGSSR